MSLYADRFVFEPNEDALGKEAQPFILYIKDIPDMSVYSRNGFVFTDVAGVHYEIKPCIKKAHLNVRKYISIWKRLREKMVEGEPAVVAE